MVAAGLGVAVLPESVQALHVDGVEFVAVEDDVHIDLALAWRTDDPSPAVARLLRALEDNEFLAADVGPSSAPRSSAVPLGGAR